MKKINENLWVPSPEEIAKAKEEQAAKEAKENGETLCFCTNYIVILFKWKKKRKSLTENNRKRR